MIYSNDRLTDLSKKINLDDFPLDIIDQIPLSIRTFKKEYKLKDLPVNIQELLLDYLNNNSNNISKNSELVLDCIPSIGSDGDFNKIDNVLDLVIEYATNYLKTNKGDYPFDATWGTNLRKYIQVLETPTRSQLIQNELKMLVRSISSDLNLNVEVKKFSMNKVSTSGLDIGYNFYVEFEVNNRVRSLNTMIM
jgi:hypothetical protein